MKKAALAALLTVGLLAGCGGGDDEPTTAGATNAPAADEGVDREKALKTAIEGYANAQLSGDIAGVTGYLNPAKCSEADKGSAAIAAGIMKDTAKGATLKVTAVKIEGDRGTMTKWELSDGAPDAVRRLIKSADQENAGKMGWGWVDGEWYRDGGCTGASASPSPSA